LAEAPGPSARCLRLPTPEEAESLAVPTQERFRLDSHQRVAPSEPLTQSRHHPAGGSIGRSRPDLPLLEEGQLLSQKQVLGHQRRPRTCGEGHQSDQVDGNQRQRPLAVHNGEELTGLDMDRAQDHTLRNVTKPALTGSDGIFADHRRRGFGAENADGIDVPRVELRRTSRRVEQTPGLQQRPANYN